MGERTTSATAAEAVYCCAPNVVWVRDVNRTIVVDPEHGQSCILQGADAAIWDWLALGYHYEEIAGLLAVLLDWSPDEAGGVFLETLQQWHRSGLVSRGEVWP